MKIINFGDKFNINWLNLLIQRFLVEFTGKAKFDHHPSKVKFDQLALYLSVLFSTVSSGMQPC